MLGKLRKKIKKVVKKDPIVKKTAKVLKKTGGPAGKAVGNAMDPATRRKATRGSELASIGDTERYETIKAPNVKTGGNTPKSGIGVPRVGGPGQKHGLVSTPGSRSRVPGVVGKKRPSVGISRPAPKTPSTPHTPGGSAFSTSAGNSLQRLGRRRKLAKF